MLDFQKNSVKFVQARAFFVLVTCGKEISMTKNDSQKKGVLVEICFYEALKGKIWKKFIKYKLKTRFFLYCGRRMQYSITNSSQYTIVAVAK